MSFDVESVRQQFPSLHQKTESGELPIYFDNPAGTQVPQKVIDAVVNYYSTMNANSGGMFITSHRTDAMVEEVREKMARFINAPNADEVAFGPNMTTLNFGLSRALAKTLSAGDEVVVTRIDHDANVSPWLRIAEDYDLTVRWVDIDVEDCTLSLRSLESVLNERTKIVATAHASNAVGTVNPVKQIAQMAHTVGAYHVVDAVQSAPHLPIDVQAIGCDFLLCSAYKFFGPHIGILWGKHDLMQSLPAYKVRPSKDKTPYRWETGTPSFETIAGVGGALDYLESLGGMQAILPYEQELTTHLIEVLQGLPGVRIYGITDPAHFNERVPTVSFAHEHYVSDQIAEYLAEQNIYVWSGHYYAIEIMDRIGKAEDGLLRVGLAHYNTHEEIERFKAALEKFLT